MLDAVVKRVTGRSTLVVAAVLGSWLLVLVLGISIPLAALRTPIETTLSRALGQMVSIEGPIAVRPTLGPSVILQDLSISARPGEQGMDRLQAGQVELQLGLLSLLRGRPRLTRVQARDVTVYLERGAIDAYPPPPVDGLTRLELSLHNLILNYRAGDADPPLQLAFEQLTGSILPGQPLQLTVGSRLGAFPYVASLTLPPPAILSRSGEPWPLRVSMELAGARLQLQGTRVPPSTEQGMFLELELQGDGAAVPDAVPRTAAGPAFAGKLSLSIRDGRPQVSGQLHLTSLDMTQLAKLAASGQYRNAALPAGAAESVPGWLNGVDTALVVHIDDISNIPVTIHDTRLNITLHNGQLNAPLGTQIAGVPFHGNVLLDTRAERPVFALSLAAAGIDAATLLRGVPGFEGVAGDVAHVALHATASAWDKTGDVTGVEAGMQVSGARLSYGNTPGGLPVSVVLDELALSAPAGETMTVTARGALADAPFAVELTAGSLDRLLQHQAWPVSVTATGGATLTASGELTNLPATSTGTLKLELSGERLGDVAPWLGSAECAATPFSMRGQLVLAKNIGRLQFLEVQLGGTRLTGELDWSRDEQLPQLDAVLQADTLDPADVAGLSPVMSYFGDGEPASGIRLDIPILPRPAVIANADIDLTVAQIAHRLVDISEVSFSGRLRDGVFQSSPFRARIGSHVLQGQLDTSGSDTGVAFEVSANDAGSGSLLDRLFSSAIQWVGNAGVVPLRWLFGQALSDSAVQECYPGSDAVPGAEVQ